MSNLIFHELRRLISRPLAIGCFIISILCVVALSTYTIASNEQLDEQGFTVSGINAIALAKKQSLQLKGPLTTEKLVETVGFYKVIKGNPSYNEIDNSGNYALNNKGYGILEKYSDVLTLIRRIYPSSGGFDYYIVDNMNPEDASSFYVKRTQLVLSNLDQQLTSGLPLSNEKEYFLKKNSNVQVPFNYGYTGAWRDMIMKLLFIVFLITALCASMGVAPAFASEIESNSASVLLTSKYGRTKVVTAKLVAAFIYSTLVFICMVGTMCIIMLSIFGIDGYDVSFQIVAPLSVEPVNMMQAFIFALIIGYSVVISLSALVLFISACTRSSFSVIVLSLLLLVLSSLIPGVNDNAFLAKLISLLPLKALNVYPVLSVYLVYDVFGYQISLANCIVICSLLSSIILLLAASYCFRKRQVFN